MQSVVAWPMTAGKCIALLTKIHNNSSRCAKVLGIQPCENNFTNPDADKLLLQKVMQNGNLLEKYTMPSLLLLFMQVYVKQTFLTSPQIGLNYFFLILMVLFFKVSYFIL